MIEWNREFNNIGLHCREHFVLVDLDDNLKSFLDEEGIGSMELADYMKKFYSESMGKELEVSQKSLAIEVLGHVYVDHMCNVINRTPIGKTSKGQKLIEWLKLHMDIIDCGEKPYDTNRFVWDALVPFSTMIFKVAGVHA